MANTKKKEERKSVYSKFTKLNGDHPFKKYVPEGYVDYAARKRRGGKLRFFNFHLAKDMGLLPKDHENTLNEELEKYILDTFSLMIINEFDIQNNKKFSPGEVLPGTYMATRYLQLQHADRSGRTSGDGRSIWNGQIKHNGKVWDVSSGGTGATRLSPATSKFNKFFESGDPTISYGCGYAELDEGIGTAIYSEVMKRNGVETEETLAIIEFEKGISINVRAHQNLLRPSHFFNYLKQNNLRALKAVTDYYIDVERSKPRWKNCPQSDKKYDFFIDVITEVFAKTTAKFENEYIFCWLDWDGDNILMDGGIIDYGSIRQFGLFHSEYRYDDVDRYSTNILEQKKKARYIVQSFLQVIDFIKTGKKKSIKNFEKHKKLKEFDRIFEYEKMYSLLYKQGFNQKQVEYLIEKHRRDVNLFGQSFYHFERAKSKRGMIKVGDGITWDAIFCMRDLMREMPQIYLTRESDLSPEEFIEILKSAYAGEDDLHISPYRLAQIKNYQESYKKLIRLISSKFNKNNKAVLLEMSMRSSVINRIERVTGDSVTFIVDKLISKKTQLAADGMFQLIESFARCQTFDVEGNHRIEMSKEGKHFKVMKSFFEIVKECREGI